MKFELLFISYTNINSKYTVDLNVKGKVILGNLFLGLRVDKFLNRRNTH